MAEKQSRYIHALRYRWLNFLYDPVVTIATKDRYLKAKLADQITSGTSSVLDIASGTGTLTRRMKTMFPKTVVMGIDGDPDMVKRAQALAAKKKLDVTYDVGQAQNLPYSDQQFDVVTSSLFFHHLQATEKTLVFSEVFRILRPNGTLLVSDWGAPLNRGNRLRFLLVQCLDGFETTNDNVQGRLPALIAEAGFREVELIDETSTPLGTIALIHAKK